MSSALAIAGVTHLLRDLLNDRVINHQVAGIMGNAVTVTALPPDRAVPSAGGGEGTKLNVFLRHVSPNLGWRNEGLPTRDTAGRTRLTNPPLALDLHYLISAHGIEDLHAEILLGHALLLLHEQPVITREAIRTSFQVPPALGAGLPTWLRALAECGLADQVEQLRITLEYLTSEEITKLWTATQSHYRTSVGCVVSVVLLQAEGPAVSPLPVLERRFVAQPDLFPPVPTLDAVVPAAGQPAATLGTKIQLKGHHLSSGPGREILLSNDRFTIEATRTESGSGGQELIEFDLLDADAAQFPVGVYRVGARVPDGSDTRETNQLALTLAPKLTNLPLSVTPNAGTATISVDVLPEVRPGQSVQLLLGQRECTPQPFATPVTTLTFVVAHALPGEHMARLRVDGIESAIINLGGAKPAFNQQRITIQ